MTMHITSWDGAFDLLRVAASSNILSWQAGLSSAKVDRAGRVADAQVKAAGGAGAPWAADQIRGHRSAPGSRGSGMTEKVKVPLLRIQDCLPMGLNRDCPLAPSPTPKAVAFTSDS